jgi:hypothetical protein
MLHIFKQKISYNDIMDIMDIDTIKTNYKYIMIDSNKGTSHIAKTARYVSDIMKDTYNIDMSHMYVRRHLLTIDDYILIEGILIKMIW